MGLTHGNVIFDILVGSKLGLISIFLFNLIFNVNSNLAESSANCSAILLTFVQSVYYKFNEKIFIKKFEVDFVSLLWDFCPLHSDSNRLLVLD